MFQIVPRTRASGRPGAHLPRRRWGRGDPGQGHRPGQQHQRDPHDTHPVGEQPGEEGEQARGEEATPASDLYSFGVMLQEIFTGRRPYPEGLDYLRLLDKVQKGETLPVSGVGSDLAALITRLKSPNAAQRPTATPPWPYCADCTCGWPRTSPRNGTSASAPSTRR